MNTKVKMDKKLFTKMGGGISRLPFVILLKTGIFHDFFGKQKIPSLKNANVHVILNAIKIGWFWCQISF